MIGEAGDIIASSSSPGNRIEVDGDFSGVDNLLADLSAASDKRSTVRGDASFLRIPALDDENMTTIRADIRDGSNTVTWNPSTDDFDID